jgi:hypothetical protein
MMIGRNVEGYLGLPDACGCGFKYGLSPFARMLPSLLIDAETELKQDSSAVDRDLYSGLIRLPLSAKPDARVTLVSAQIGVLRFGFVIYGQIRVGTLPKRQELFIRSSRCLRLTREDLCASQLQFGKSTNDEPFPDAGMIQNLPELSRCKAPLFQLEIGKTPQIRGIYIVKPVGNGEVVRLYRPQEFNSSGRIIFGELYRCVRRWQAESLDRKILGEEQVQLFDKLLRLLNISGASKCQCCNRQNPAVLAFLEGTFYRCKTPLLIFNLGIHQSILALENGVI